MSKSFGLNLFAFAAVAAALGGCLQNDSANPSSVQALTKSSATGQCPNLEKFTSELATKTCTTAGACVTAVLDAWEPILNCLNIPRPTGDTPEDLVGLIVDLGNKVPSSGPEALDFAECVCGTSVGGGSAGTSGGGFAGFSATSSNAGGTGFNASSSNAGGTGFSAQ